MVVFSRHMFAYTTMNQNQDEKLVGTVTINLMIKHAYLTTTIISDKGSTFVSQKINDIEV